MWGEILSDENGDFVEYLLHWKGDGVDYLFLHFLYFASSCRGGAMMLKIFIFGKGFVAS